MNSLESKSKLSSSSILKERVRHRIIVLGGCWSGKRYLVGRWCDGELHSIDGTLCCHPNFWQKTDENNVVQFVCFCSTWQNYDSFQRYTKIQANSSTAILIVFDLTEYHSKRSGVLSHFKYIEDFKLPVVVCATKCDLIGQRQISSEDAKSWSATHFPNAPFFETSAVTKTNIYEAYKVLINLSSNYIESKKSIQPQTVNLQTSKVKYTPTCVNCNSEFGILFKRKKICSECNLIYCSDCLKNKSNENSRLPSSMCHNCCDRKLKIFLFASSFGENDVLLKKFKVLKVIGRGGFGITFKAQNISTNELVVVKKLMIDENCEEEKRNKIEQLFSREANFLEMLEHSNIPKLICFESPFLVMTFIDGINLKSFKASSDEIQKMLITLSNVLKYLEEKGVKHRDIKPENIMLESVSKEYYLVDFGAAKEEDLSIDSQTTGIHSPIFASPEQLSLQSTTVTTDIYSLGLTLIHSLTGSPNRNFKDESTPLNKILTKMIRNSAIQYSTAKELSEDVLKTFF